MCVGSVDRRVESEESADEEGKKQNSGMVADLSAHSLKDGEERGDEDPEGTGREEGLRPTQRQDTSSAVLSLGTGEGCHLARTLPTLEAHRAQWARAWSRAPSEALAESAPYVGHLQARWMVS